MSSAALVRFARAEDVGSILALERGTPEAPHWPETVYREYIGVSSQELLRKALWIAVVNDRVCGFAAASALAGDAELETIAVETCMRRSGIGDRLLDCVTKWAQDNGAKRMLLEVRSENASARAFYRSRGFLEEGRRPHYYSDPDDDATLMTLELTGSTLQHKTPESGEL